MSGSKGDQKWSDATQVWSKRIDTEGLARFLRARHPDKTAAHVAARTGQPVDTVKKWLTLEATPGGRAMVILFLEYGLDLIDAMVVSGPAWLSAAVRAEQQRALRAEIDERNERLKALDL